MPKVTRTYAIEGKRAGKLQAMWPVGRVNKKMVVWLCLCDCGQLVTVRVDHLNRDVTKSCGCLSRAGKFGDLTGHKFGRLTVCWPSGRTSRRAVVAWLCMCECGKLKIVTASALLNGGVRSCGCFRKEAFRGAARCAKIRNAKLIHGDSSHHGKQAAATEYTTWNCMIQRCTNSKNPSFKNYGGRGITVCDRWRNSYAAFIADMGRRPPKTSIDRINNDGNYELGNCRWATATQQVNNRRCSKANREIL